MGASPPPRVFETSVDVRSYELDSFNHANHAVILNYFEHARFQALASGGFSYDALRERGMGVYVVRLEVEYVKEARLGDRLLVRTTAEAPRRASMVLVQELVRADDPEVTVARARVTAVWVGPDRRPIPVPDVVREAFGLSGAGDVT